MKNAMRNWAVVAGMILTQSVYGAPASTPTTRTAGYPAATPTKVAPAPARTVRTAVPPQSAQPSRMVALPEVESATGVGLTAKIGTLGLGADLTVGMNEYLGLRFEANGGSYKDTYEAEDSTIKGDIEWLTYGALLDWYPAGGGFRISGGGFLNKNKVKLSADTSETVELDGQEYWLEDLKGEVTFSDFAPYVGIGYGNAVGVGQRWHFSCDFGVMFQGEPEISASATASDPAIQGEVDRALDREVGDIQDDANAFKYYPVISVGVAYKF